MVLEAQPVPKCSEDDDDDPDFRVTCGLQGGGGGVEGNQDPRGESGLA